MNWQKIKQELEEKHPDKNIMMLPQDNPTEILCEIDPPEEHPDYSIAISVIEKSDEHFHKTITEEYEVVKGTVNLFIDGGKKTLSVGDKVIIKPGVKHWAESNSGWVKVTARPAWTQEDHILI